MRSRSVASELEAGPTVQIILARRILLCPVSARSASVAVSSASLRRVRRSPATRSNLPCFKSHSPEAYREHPRYAGSFSLARLVRFQSCRDVGECRQDVLSDSCLVLRRDQILLFERIGSPKLPLRAEG